MSAAAPLGFDARLGLLVEQRKAIRDQGESIALLMAALQLLCRRPAVERCHDPVAERRILGALLFGKVSLEDLGDLEAGDFLAPGHRVLFALATTVLELDQEAAAAGRALPRWLSLSRSLRHSCELVWKLGARDPRITGAQLAELDAALQRLVVPAHCPRRAIDLVATLGRRWRA